MYWFYATQVTVKACLPLVLKLKAIYVFCRFLKKTFKSVQKSGVYGQIMRYLHGVCYIEQILIFHKITFSLNSNLMINLSEGDITVESACLICIIICLQYTIIVLFSCFIYYVHFFLFQGCLKTNNYIEIVQMVLLIILQFFIE